MDSAAAGVDSAAGSSLFDDLDAIGTQTEAIPPIAADAAMGYESADGVGSVAGLTSAAARGKAFGADAAGAITSADPANPAYRNRPRWRTVAVAVTIALIAVVAFILVRFFISQSASSASADAAYSAALKTAKSNRSSLRTVVNSTKKAAAGLVAALPESTSAQNFQNEWTTGRNLVDNPPDALTSTPQNQDQARAYTQNLQAYTAQAQDCAKKLNDMKTTAGKDDATDLFLSNQSALSTSLQSAQSLLTSITDAQKDASSVQDTASGHTLTLSIDQQALTALTTAVADATKLTQSTATGTPYQIAQAALKMAAENTTVTNATSAAQKSFNQAQQQLQQQKDALSKSTATNGQIPQALVGTWKTDDGSTMTFAADSLQGHYAQAESISLDGIADVDGAKPTAAWKLTSGGQDDGIEDTQVVLYANGNTQFLTVSAHGETWKLTR